MKRLLLIILCVLLIVPCISSCEKEVTYKEVTKTEHFTIYEDDFQYYMKNSFSQFYSNYADYASYIGIDFEKPLKSQTCTFSGEDDENFTWFDYFVENTKDMINTYLIMGEYAIENGFKWSKDNDDSVSNQLSDIDKLAKDNNYKSADDYLKYEVGEYVSTKTLKNVLSLYEYAHAGYDMSYNGKELAPTDYEEYAQNNKGQIYMCDYFGITLNDGEKANELNDKITDLSSFVTLVNDYYRSIYEVVSNDEESDKDNNIYTESEFEALMSTFTNNSYKYSQATEKDAWLFDKNTKAGDHKVIENKEDSCFDLCFLIKETYRDETKSVDVRHILFSLDDYETDEKAKEKADEIYALYSAKPSEDYFAELANQYSNDPGSSSNGGLYSNLAEGTTVEEFNAWCFDDSRKTGDCDIVKTSYGYHIMYYVNAGLPSWQTIADGNIRANNYSEAFSKEEEKLSIQFNEEILKSMPDFLAE